MNGFVPSATARLVATCLSLACWWLTPALPAQPVRLTTDGQDKYRPCWSHDGKQLLFARQTSDGSNIWQYVMDRDSQATRRLDERDARVEYNGAFSPDDKQVLFASISLSGTQGNVDLAVIGVDGSDFRLIVKDQGKLAHQDWPSWSPDGARFAFSSTHEGNQEIYTAKSDGTDLARLTQSPGQDAHPCWSPDGDAIVFATDRWGGLELAQVKPDGTGLRRLTASPGFDDYPAVSPDGKHIAFVSNRDQQLEIYVLSPDQEQPRNLSRHPGRDTFPTWTPDGRGVTIVSDRDGGTDLYTLPFDP